MVLEDLVVFIEPFNFSFFSITNWAIDLDCCDIKWFAFETTEIILSFLRLYPSTAFLTLIEHDGYSISS